MRILGLDFGQKRIGVAVSDPLGYTAQGLSVILYDQPEEALEKLEQLCREFAVERIVVGLPLNMDGSSGPAAREAAAFASRLESLVDVPVELVDERLTSRTAEKVLIEGKVRRKARKQVKDKLAAVLILESFLAGPRKQD